MAPADALIGRARTHQERVISAYVKAAIRRRSSRAVRPTCTCRSASDAPSSSPSACLVSTGLADTSPTGRGSRSEDCSSDPALQPAAPVGREDGPVEHEKAGLRLPLEQPPHRHGGHVPTSSLPLQALQPTASPSGLRA